jgi:hypothetical protein
MRRKDAGIEANPSAATLLHRVRFQLNAVLCEQPRSSPHPPQLADSLCLPRVYGVTQSLSTNQQVCACAR